VAAKPAPGLACAILVLGAQGGAWAYCDLCRILTEKNKKLFHSFQTSAYVASFIRQSKSVENEISRANFTCVLKSPNITAVDNLSSFEFC
jgi:hypothetical protein